MNYSIPMLRKNMSQAQVLDMVNPSLRLARSPTAISKSLLSSQSHRSIMRSTPQPHLASGGAVTSTGLPIFEFSCLDPLHWWIEQISLDLSNLCCG